MMTEAFTSSREAAAFLEQVLPQYEQTDALPDSVTHARITAADRSIPVNRSFLLNDPDYLALATRVMRLEQRMRQAAAASLAHAGSDSSDRT